MLGRGADIDTANVDGLTALHQVQGRQIYVNVQILNFEPEPLPSDTSELIVNANGIGFTSLITVIN